MIAPNTFVTHNIEFLWMKEEEDETQGGTIVRQYRFRKDGKQASALIYGTEQLRSMPNYDDYAMDKAVDIIKRLE